MSEQRPCLLLVDDEDRILRSLKMLFRNRFDVLTTTSGHEALELVAQRTVHVVVSDQRMPGMSGTEVLRGIAERSPSTMRILLTGYADMEAVAASVNEGEIWRFVEKPWNASYLIDVVNRAAEIALREFAATDDSGAGFEGSPVEAVRESPDARVLVLDADPELPRLVRELLPKEIVVAHAKELEPGLDYLAGHEVAVVVVHLAEGSGMLGEAIKQLKRVRPATLAIIVTPLRSSRLVIELINEGQIYRFLLQPAPRELLRRGLQSALERYAQLRTRSQLVERHRVETTRTTLSALPSRLLDYWRRIRESTSSDSRVA